MDRKRGRNNNAGKTPAPKRAKAASPVNYSRLPRTPSGHLRKINVINAWTRTKVAQNIRAKSIHNLKSNLNNTSNNTRRMAVALRRMFIHNAPRSNQNLTLYRGLTIPAMNAAFRKKENGPSSWSTRRATARVFSFIHQKKNPNAPPGIVLRVKLNKNTPYIKIPKQKRLRYSSLEEHILPPGIFTPTGYNEEERVYNVKFTPNPNYLTRWKPYVKKSPSPRRNT